MDRFNICQAYLQLESDYNVGGLLQERPSNQRRQESIGCQLARIGFNNPYGWVDIEDNPGGDDHDGDEVREIYMRAVLRLDLPINLTLMHRMHEFFTPEFLARYPQTLGDRYKQG